MKILAIIGSYRKGKTIDTLVSKAIEGAVSKMADAKVDKIYLIDKHMEYCRNCMACRKDDKSKEIADCVITDDLTELLPVIQEADFFVFGTPINCGTVTAVMKTFLERTTWTLAKPGKNPIEGCPEPRTAKKKKAVILLSTGIVPSELRNHCDDATSLIESNCECCFNAEVVGSLYAGAVESKGLSPYLDEAFRLGEELVS
ncbi:MAG: flavodoxin family protein [Deltaproteobacteria bacterium]|nr:flavodoxin family protein [Deltaproteobacteria bacterium]